MADVEDPDGWDAEVARIRALRPEVAATVFETMEGKRHSLDQMMWQTPALALVAQSFLLTIGLGHESSWSARLVAVTLGIVTALGSIQLMLKHRFHEELHSWWLEQFVLARDWPGATPTRIRQLAYRHAKHRWDQSPAADASRLRKGGHRLRHRMARRSSPYIWITVMAVFAIAQASVFVLGLVALIWGSSPL